MENRFKQRIAVQQTIMGYIQQLIEVNNLSPSLVEDALNKIIVQLHPLIIEEIFSQEEKMKEVFSNLEKAKEEAQVETINFQEKEVTDE